MTFAACLWPLISDQLLDDLTLVLCRRGFLAGITEIFLVLFFFFVGVWHCGTACCTSLLIAPAPPPRALAAAQVLLSF
jgi:hypothetical protein